MPAALTADRGTTGRSKPPLSAPKIWRTRRRGGPKLPYRGQPTRTHGSSVISRAAHAWLRDARPGHLDIQPASKYRRIASFSPQSWSRIVGAQDRAISVRAYPWIRSMAPAGISVCFRCATTAPLSSLVASHVVIDGLGRGQAIADAAAGRTRDLGYPLPGSRTRRRAVREDGWQRPQRLTPDQHARSRNRRA